MTLIHPFTIRPADYSVHAGRGYTDNISKAFSDAKGISAQNFNGPA
jgi:hypothetical protein